jgi:hypothetical protein
MAGRGKELESTGSAQMSMGNAKAATPPPFSPRRPEILLITKGRTKNEAGYPAMSMIISWLFISLCQAVYYFQQDGLWKSINIMSRNPRTHDVYDQKGVRLRMRKLLPLLSARYREDRVGSCVAEPTISLMEKELMENRHFPNDSVCY